MSIPWLEILIGVLRFPEQVLLLVKTLKETPVESRERIMDSIRKESDSLRQKGRPTWD